MRRQPLHARLLAWPLVCLVWTYRLTLGPLLGPACRFQPTCSEYALDALKRHGPGRGSWLAVRRLARCHPWGSSGYDPVPGIHPETTCRAAPAEGGPALEPR